MDPSRLPALPRRFSWSFQPVDTGLNIHVSILIDRVDRIAYAYLGPDDRWMLVLEAHDRGAVFHEAVSRDAACGAMAAWAWNASHHLEPREALAPRCWVG